VIYSAFSSIRPKSSVVSPPPPPKEERMKRLLKRANELNWCSVMYTFVETDKTRAFKREIEERWAKRRDAERKLA
jgi:hypothetical protein